jgi:hypothetical protein
MIEAQIEPTGSGRLPSVRSRCPLYSIRTAKTEGIIEAALLVANAEKSEATKQEANLVLRTLLASLE